MSLSHYDVLGVARDATTPQIQAAYKKLALALHPDRNAFGGPLMQRVNRARDVLRDDAQRRAYDRALRNGGGDEGDVVAGGASALQRRLREAHAQMAALRAELAVARAAATPPRDAAAQMERLHQRLQRSEESRTTLRSQVVTLQSENFSLSSDLQEAEKEKQQLAWETRWSEREAAHARRDLDEALREEKMRASAAQAAAVRAEREQAERRVDAVRKALSERSLCHCCRGRDGAECPLCRGFGCLHGRWTKCHKCDGTGSCVSLLGQRSACRACFSRGAREGALVVACFKCEGTGEGTGKGAGTACDACYAGKIRGFHLKRCPFCLGKGCDNCHDKGFVSCH